MESGQKVSRENHANQIRHYLEKTIISGRTWFPLFFFASKLLSPLMKNRSALIHCLRRSDQMQSGWPVEDQKEKEKKKKNRTTSYPKSADIKACFRPTADNLLPDPCHYYLLFLVSRHFPAGCKTTDQPPPASNLFIYCFHCRVPLAAFSGASSPFFPLLSHLFDGLRRGFLMPDFLSVVNLPLRFVRRLVFGFST